MMSVQFSLGRRDVQNWRMERIQYRIWKAVNGKLVLPKQSTEAQDSIYSIESANVRFSNALTRMGVPCLEAYLNPETPTCFGLYQRRCLNASGGRCSTYHAFLSKSLVCQRKNLTIVIGAHVQRILFSNDSKLRATGLLIEGKERMKLYTVRARHEIIICGGAIVSPQLLLLRYTSYIQSNSSGVGPKEHLLEVGKPCIHDLPGVGSTLVLQF